FSADLVASLVAIESSPWAEFKKGEKPLTATTLSHLLKKYEITPRTVRRGEATAKGYQRAWFADAWDRYLAPETPFPLNSGSETSHPSQCSIHAGLTHFSETSQEGCVTFRKSEESPVFTRVVTGVTGQKGDKGVLQVKKTLQTCPACGSFAL